MKIFHALIAFMFSATMVWAEAPTSTQSITPCLIFKNLNKDGIQSHAVVSGVDYKIEKSEGFNSKVHLSGAKSNQRNHLHFHIEGHYRFITNQNATLYPLVRVSYAQYGLTKGNELDSTHIVKKKLHMGLGIEKSFSGLTMGLKGEIIQDLSNQVLSQSGRSISGSQGDKSTAYKFFGYGRYAISDTGAIEVEPFYGRCFEGKYSENGCKIGYVFSF